MGSICVYLDPFAKKITNTNWFIKKSLEKHVLAKKLALKSW